MRIIISFAALFLSIILLQLPSGALGPLDALSGSMLGFTTTQIGMLGSAHFFGFFIGSWWSPRLMGAIGHSRTFAVFTACGVIGALAHTLTDDPNLWAFMRILSGLCIAGCYTVIEAWIHAKVTNQSRGRVFGIYRVIDLSASLFAQLMLTLLSPTSYVSYNILAIIICAAIFPLTLSRAEQPATPKLPRLRPLHTMRLTPLSSMGVVVAGVSTASFRMVGPVYGDTAGLTQNQIAYFLAICILGGAVAQIPVGWLADKFPRRHVLLGLSVASIISSWLVVFSVEYGTIAIYAASFLFGLSSFAIFSVSSALANDFAKTEDMVELAASLMFIYGIGAIGAPFIASGLMQAYGAAAMFALISVAHLGLLVFGIYRSTVRQAPDKRGDYVYTPRTSFIVGKLRKKDKE